MGSKGGKRRVGQRTCIVCASKRPKLELLRLVLVGETRVRLDRRQRYHGRGGYVCSRPECLARLKLSHLQRAFRQSLPNGAWDPALAMVETLQSCGKQFWE